MEILALIISLFMNAYLIISGIDKDKEIDRLKSKSGMSKGQKKSIQREIKILRETKQYKEIAKAMGVSYTYITRLANGNMKMSYRLASRTLKKLRNIK